MKNLLVIILLSFFVFSCQEDWPQGKQGDTIKFSTKKLTLTAQGGETFVTSKGSNWVIENCLLIDGEDYYLHKGDPIVDGDLEEYYLQRGDQFTVVVDSLGYDILLIEGLWIKIVKEDKKLTFFADKNETGKERILTVPIRSTNYFTAVSLIQKAE